MGLIPNSSNSASEKKGELRYRIMDSAIFVCIFLVFFLIPVFFTGLINQGLGFEKSLLFYFLTLIGVVLWATKGVVSGELKLKRTPLDLPILAVLITFIVSASLSVSIKDSFIGFYGSPAKSVAFVVVLALFYYLVVNNMTIDKLKKLFWGICASTLLVLVYSFFQIFNIHLLPFIEATKTPGFNPISSLTGLTIYLVAMIPFFVIAASQTFELYPNLKNSSALTVLKIVSGVGVLALLVFLFFLNGFTYWPIAVVTIVIVLMFMLAKIIPVKQYDLMIAVAVFLILMIFLVLGNFNIINLNLPTEVSLSRTISYTIAKQAVMNDPIFGSGVGTFYYDFGKYKDSVFNSSPLWNIRFDTATGSLFELVATVGILGTLALVVLILILLSMTFIALIKSKEKEGQIILLAAFASFISLLAFGGMFAFNNALILCASILIVFTAAAAINIYPERFETLSLSFKASPKYALALAAIFLVVTAGVAFLFTMGIKMYLADLYAKKALVTTDSNVRFADLNRSISLAPFQDSYYLNMANYQMGLANQEAQTTRDQQKIQQYLGSAVQSGKKAQELNPNFAGVNESLGLIYENASFYTRGALEWAETYYKKVIDLEPINPVPNLRLALINMAKSNAETDKTEKEFYINEAIKQYDESISKKNDFSSAYYGKAIALEQLAKSDEAIDTMKSAAVYSNNNIDYFFELGRLYFNKGVTQPNLFQTASKNLTQNSLNEGQKTTTGEQPKDLSVQPDQSTGQTTELNDQLKNAEQIFASIVAVNQNHANALYSLALLYQKTNQPDKASAYVKKLLEILTDEASKETVKTQFTGLY